MLSFARPGCSVHRIFSDVGWLGLSSSNHRDGAGFFVSFSAFSAAFQAALEHQFVGSYNVRPKGPLIIQSGVIDAKLQLRPVTFKRQDKTPSFQFSHIVIVDNRRHGAKLQQMTATLKSVSPYPASHRRCSQLLPEQLELCQFVCQGNHTPPHQRTQE